MVAVGLLDIGNAATGVAALLLALLAFLGFQTLPELAKATPITRRRWLKRQLRRIGVGVRVGYVTALIGSPAFTRRIPQGGTSISDESKGNPKSRPATEVIYVLDDAFVQVIAVDDGDLDNLPVTAVAVTQRHIRFRPKFHNQFNVFADRRGNPTLQLGRTTFASLEQSTAVSPDGFFGWLGARRAGWAENYYFGNPGGYQNFIVAFNDAGSTRSIGTFPRQSPVWQAGSFAYPSDLLDNSEIQDPAIVEWRTKTTVNTYIVLAPDTTPAEALHWGLGPDLDRVRLLPS